MGPAIPQFVERNGKVDGWTERGYSPGKGTFDIVL